MCDHPFPIHVFFCCLKVFEEPHETFFKKFLVRMQGSALPLSRSYSTEITKS